MLHLAMWNGTVEAHGAIIHLDRHFAHVDMGFSGKALAHEPVST